MMTEQQMTLKNNTEMQEKWKSCIRVTCYAYRTAELFIEVSKQAVVDTFNRLFEVVSQIVNNFVETLTNIFKEIVRPICENLIDKGYPQSYKHNVYNFNVYNFNIDTIGFPRPIIQCARSRC